MELILIGYCALTVTLLVVHLAEYLMQWPRGQFARREDPIAAQRPQALAAKPLQESALPFDQAA